jgi:hypothetical protein
MLKINCGGASRNRTDVQGFAILCMTTLPSRHFVSMQRSFAGRCMTTLPPRQGARGLFQLRIASPHNIPARRKSKRENRCCAFSPLGILERERRLELPTSTLARLRSTN